MDDARHQYNVSALPLPVIRHAISLTKGSLLLFLGPFIPSTSVLRLKFPPCPRPIENPFHLHHTIGWENFLRSQRFRLLLKANPL
jgi:hypothetical protein